MLNNPELLALDGRRVRAMTYASDEYDRPVEPVEGVLRAEPDVPVLGRTCCWVRAGARPGSFGEWVQVDSATVERLPDEGAAGAGSGQPPPSA